MLIIKPSTIAARAGISIFSARRRAARIRRISGLTDADYSIHL